MQQMVSGREGRERRNERNNNRAKTPAVNRLNVQCSNGVV